MHDPEKRVLNANVIKRVGKRGKVEKVVDTESGNLVNK